MTMGLTPKPLKSGESRRVVERLRKLAMALPDATEKQSWGHPNWRAQGKTFASFDHYKGRDLICFLVELPLRDQLIKDARVQDLGHARGGKTWVGLPADGKLDWVEIKDLLKRAHQLVRAPHRQP